MSRNFCKMLLVRSNTFLTTKNFFILGVVAVMYTLVSHEYLYSNVMKSSHESEVIKKQWMEFHKQIVDQYYNKRQYWKTSNLGSTIFKNVNSKRFSHRDRQNKTYTVLIWKHYKWLEQRHIFSYGRSRTKTLDECSVKNCVFTGNDTALEYADAVVVHLLKGKIPDLEPRPPHQRWVALSDEAATHTFTLTRTKNRSSFSKLANIFNWTMTFRSESEIPVPYGRTVPLRKPNIVSLPSAQHALKQLVPYVDNKQFHRPIAILASNCIKRRMRFYTKLKQNIRIDMYGGCSTLSRHMSKKCACSILNKYREDALRMSTGRAFQSRMARTRLLSIERRLRSCVSEIKLKLGLRYSGALELYKTARKICQRSGHYGEDFPIIHKYLFYLVHENSECRQYLSEKTFYHGYAKGAIPIIVGPPKEDCENLLPPKSYLHFDDYGTTEKLASKIHSILADNSLEQLLSYHKWRMHFKVLNEHGYFGTKSVHYCRICEALNYNDERVSIYGEKQLRMFFDPKKACK